MAWKFVLYGLDGTAIGEVQNAKDRQVHLELNGLATASFQIRLDNPLADDITVPGGNFLNAGDVLLVAYQGATVRFAGELTSAQEDGSGTDRTVTCNFSGALWRLQKRLAYPASKTYTAQDRAQIVKDLLLFANSQQDVNAAAIPTGIVDGTYDVSSPTNYTAAGVSVAQAITELQPGYTWNYFVPSPLVGSDGMGGHNAIPGNFDGSRQLDTGQAWGNAGTGADWQTDPTNVLKRTESADGGFYASFGRQLVPAGISLANVQVGADFSFAMTSGATQCVTGVMARRSTFSDWVGAFVTFVGYATPTSPNAAFYISFIKCSGGVAVAAKSTDITSIIEGGTPYTLALQIDTLGNYTIYWGPQGAPTFILGGTDATIPATGTVGVYDVCHGTQAGQARVLDNFYVGVPTATNFGLPFDFEVVPQAPVPPSKTVGTLNVRNRIGADKPNLVFEYPSNVLSYSRAIDRDNLCTRAWSLGDPNVSVSNDAAIATRGLYEDVITEVQGQPAGLRTAFAELAKTVRSVPRQVVTFAPAPNAPQYGTDYVIGDTVVARAVHNGIARFNGSARVQAVDIAIDELGKETATPTLSFT